MRAALGLVALLAAAALLTAGDPGPAEARYTALGVTGDEWDLLLSRKRVNPGRAAIEYRNAGEDPHDLKIRRRGHRKVRSIAELGPGELAEINMRLKRGKRYVLWCSLQGGLHRQWGMQADLEVRRKRR